MEDTDEAVAVIGIGCNFPGGEGLENFWKVLLEGRNCAIDIPADRFHVASWFDPDEGKPGKTQTTRAALIDGFNEFDHRFFGISEVEADFMDPQQKLLLQCSFRALEDAGVPLEDISGTRTGVYIGLMNKDYEMIRSNCPTAMNHYSGTGTAMSIAANRISFTFNLTGPSFAIDSACSSSLVALHVARQAITQGDCDMALCGGVSCIIEPRVFVALSKAKMISPDGTSKPFSDKADGYGRGEGCGVVLLKPLEKAKQDGNKIWGVISKTAINQDGHSVSPITKPSRTQQEELLRGIYTDIDPAHVQYVEAHGTGTPIGDLTEAASISNIIAKTRPPGSEALRIGSVKGNIGHTESAAGVAGLIKVLLMMKHQAFVSSVLYSQGASSVDPKSLGLNVLSKVERWNTSGSACRVAGINSFGFGGTNAHAVVREFRQVEAPQIRPKILPNLFVLSAASEKSLVESLSDTSQRLSDCRTSDLEALCFTSACARSHQKHKYRKVLLVSTVSDLLNHVKSESSCTSPVGNTEVVFVFSGNGVAYRGMCRQLFREFAVFRVKVKEVEALFRKHKRIHLSEMFDDGECDLGKPGVVQPLLFAIQVAIVALLKEWGVTPDVVLGHSLGEVAAAHCSGLLSLEDAVKVVHHRSALQSTVTGGKMLVVGNVAVAKVVEVLKEFSGKICVAAFNSPRSCTLSGERDAVDAIRETLKKSFVGENIFLCDLSVSSAYHSHLMDPVMDDIRSRIQRLDVHDKHCKLFSTVSGAEGLDEDFMTGEYWAKNVREPVLFEQTLRALSQNNKKSMVFVEIGPRRALQKNIQETLGHDALVLPSVQPETELETVLTTVGKLFELGVNVCWRKIYQDRKTLRTDFPIYHFDNTKKRLFFEAIRRGDEPPSRCQHVLLSQTKGESGEYVCNLSAQALLYLQEHKYGSMSIVPGAFYVELAFSSLLAHLKTKGSSLQLSLSFQNLLTISSNNQLLKMSAVVALGCLTAKPGFPSQIGSIIVSGPLHEEMVLYLRSARECPDFLEFRQVVLALKHARHPVTLRVITLKSSETCVDHISCGFVLSGMMRACAAEVPELSFQLLDLGSTTSEDIEALARAMSSCKQETASPYIAKQLTAVTRGEIQNIVPDNSVQVQLTKLCVHSSDYFAITLSQRSHLFKKNCVYIVTGGLTGLGRETVKFIAHNGGGCIVTLSRRSLTDHMQSEMELLQKRCCVKIANLRCDVSVSSQVTESILKVEQVFQSCPIKGVFHSAAVLHDGLIENLDEALFRKVLHPKVGGALNLHFATLHKKLDFFVCYSSISSFIGNASQCNYAAANSFLDMFCHYRRNQGLAGQSINWGPLNLGLLLDKDHFQRFLETKGMMVMDVCEIHDALKKCLLLNRPQQVICKFNFKNLNRHVLSQNESLRERLSTLVEAELKDQLAEEPGTSELSSVHDCVRRIVSNIINISIGELDDDSTLCSLGIDSMLAMTLQNKVFQDTGVNVPLVHILDPTSTTGSLVAFLENSK
ncbi:uncharacterized protein ACB058_001812 [Synchiropus picturatus]